MPLKRLRRASPTAQGLSAGERLKRAKLVGNEYLAWSWVGTEVTDTADITQEHRLATCGFSNTNRSPFCSNKYSTTSNVAAKPGKTTKAQAKTEGELEDDIIVISDNDSPTCSSKACKNNPNCLNYLGQEKWESEEKARDAFIKAQELGPDPTLDSRAFDTPVGLKNLGATCYANAFLQVWYQDLPFRTGVYKCQPAQDVEHKFEESPIFQLQVTFAAMQMSKQAAFNPVKLVESLKLNTTEQQDAQEFSKLFMAHLDSEFQKQVDSSLKSLIADQFQGKQVYATVCTNCQNRSERESEFLEIEVTISNNSKLDERIAALLKPEDLDGDNKYLCSKCESLQNAKRYTELRELPPVLHFSLLRFVYDLSTMERKKSKHYILFPKSINMDEFVTTGHQNEAKKEKMGGKNMYHLRGVLLHKGPSAYHGHYEAQIFDVRNEAWYQFNDEVVTKISSLGPSPKVGQKSGSKENGNAKPIKAQMKGKSAQTQKKPTRVDSDVEILDISSKSTSPPVDDSNYISSRDAYMLIYVRAPAEPPATQTSSPKDDASFIKTTDTSADGTSKTAVRIPIPPYKAQQVVQSLNIVHDKACDEYTAKEVAAEARFKDIRDRVMDIYRSWNLASNAEENAVVSRQALESWLSRHLKKPPASARDALVDREEAEAMDVDEYIHEISNSDIVCIHGRLDPNKATNMKRIEKAADSRIQSDDECRFVPSFGSSDVCEECVKELFLERLYQIEHPRLVSRFDDVCQVEDDELAYWISKTWLKDWRSGKPKMHKPSSLDPPPDDPEYDHHVRCEHGGLTANTISRKRISLEAYELLQGVFVDWSTLSTESEVCAICETLVHISKEDRRGAKIQAEEEKAKLKHMHDNALTGGTNLLEHVPCALIPAQFVRAWKQWLFNPAGRLRPDGIDNTAFICQHGLLVLDPNCPSDLDASIAIITRCDWDALENMYPSGPLIALENSGTEWLHDLDVCQNCRKDRKSTFETTELTIRVLRPEDPTPTPETAAKQSSEPKSVQPMLVTYGSRKIGNLRQSKRIRQVREVGRRRRVTVTREMTVKALKMEIQAELDIPTISQRIYYQGYELEDNAVTLGSLGIMSNDAMDLREEDENSEFLDAEPGTESRRADEGQGFGGTLLGSSGQPPSSPQTPSEHSDGMSGMLRACPLCTFENPPEFLACEMCDTKF